MFSSLPRRRCRSHPLHWCLYFYTPPLGHTGPVPRHWTFIAIRTLPGADIQLLHFVFYSRVSIIRTLVQVWLVSLVSLLQTMVAVALTVAAAAAPQKSLFSRRCSSTGKSQSARTLHVNAHVIAQNSSFYYYYLFAPGHGLRAPRTATRQEATVAWLGMVWP